MPLIFPSNPVVGQTYQSGSSSTYQWNGSYWETIIPPTQVFATAVSASLAQTASFAVTASFALNAGSGGGGGGVAGFATIRLANQSILSFPQDITWTTLNTTGSGVTLPSGSGTAFIRIPSGSWRITTSLNVAGFSNTTAGAAQVELVNVSNASIPGFAPMYFIPITSTGTDIVQGTVDGVLAVTTPTTTIKVRATGGLGTSNISAAFTTGMIIQRIS